MDGAKGLQRVLEGVARSAIRNRTRGLALKREREGALDVAVGPGLDHLLLVPVGARVDRRHAGLDFGDVSLGLVAAEEGVVQVHVAQVAARRGERDTPLVAVVVRLTRHFNRVGTHRIGARDDAKRGRHGLRGAVPRERCRLERAPRQREGAAASRRRGRLEVGADRLDLAHHADG